MNLEGLLKFEGGFFDIPLFTIADTPITVATLAVFGLILVLTWVMSLVLRRGLERVLGARGITEEGTVGPVTRLLHYLVVAVGVGVALETIGVNLSTLFAAGAIFAIGIGFAMQNIAQNFVSGVILLIERTIKPGDVLLVEGRVVRVRKMGIRATIAQTLDNEEVIVPNSAMVQSTVTNYTLQDSIYRLRATVGVTYGSDMALVKRTLEETAAKMSWRQPDKDPLVLLREFGDSSVNFEVSVWMDNPWRALRTRSQLNEAIWWALQEKGITIAFPQVDVHFDPEVVDSLRMRAVS